MIRNSLLLLLASVALAQTGNPTQPPGSIAVARKQIMGGTADAPVGVTVTVPIEGNQIMSGTASLGRGKLSVHYTTTITTPPSHLIGFNGGLKSDSTGMHRYLVRKNDSSYLGYDLVLGPGDATNGYQISFQPVTGVEDVLQRASGGAALTPMALPKYPAPQIVHDGDIVVLDLMASPDGSEKLTDYLQFFAKAPEPKAVTTTGAARDFALDDGPLHVQFAESRFYIDGQQYHGNSNFQQRAAGSTFWFALPNQGRYVLSLEPHDGFTQNGEVRDNAIRFEDAGHRYELRTMSNIAGAGGAFHLYMRHDLEYQPKPGKENAVSAGMDRLENLAPNQ